MSAIKGLRKRFEKERSHRKFLFFSGLEPVDVEEFNKYTIVELYMVAGAALLCGGFIGWVLHAVHP